MEGTLLKEEHGTCARSSHVNGLAKTTVDSRMSIVPSRTLILTATHPIDWERTPIREVYEQYGPLKSICLERQCIVYYDLRHSAAALGASNVGEHQLVAKYCTDAVARDIDEGGRVVVRVEGHLGLLELCHIFSTYGDVRNIQEIPNVNVHRVVEFFDCRCAAKAVEALNAVDVDMRATTVAYLERSRCKRILIPPRLSTMMGCEDNRQESFEATTLPLGPTKSSSLDCLYPSPDAEAPHSKSLSMEAAGKLMHVHSPRADTIGSMLWGFGDSKMSSIPRKAEEILPSKLGLYEDEEENSEPIRVGVAHSYHWPSLWTGDAADGCALLPKSVMEQLSVPEETPRIDMGMNSLLTQYVEYLESGWMLQQAVDMELAKRLQQLKCFENPSEMHRLPNGEDWKMMARHQRKKNRFPRRPSAADMEQEAERKAQQQKMFAMDLERVKSGKDKRTTLMIKNIPNKYTQKMLLSRIELDFKGTFDFFYLPIDFKNKCNVGYGFINMTATEHIVKFVEHVHEQKWDKFNSDKVCCVTYARIQGRHALINHFQNSNLMLEDSKHQPLLFKPNGDPEPFPTKSVST